MKFVQLTTSDMWTRVFRVLEIHNKGDVHSKHLDEDENNALENLALRILTTYRSRKADLEYLINQTICTHYILSSDNEKLMQFNIHPEDSTIDVMLHNTDSLDLYKWPGLLQVSDGELHCKNLRLRCHIRLDALNKLFDVSEKTSKQLRSMFGSAYHGVDIVSYNTIILASKHEIYHDVSEICHWLEEDTVRIVQNAEWFDSYLASYQSDVRMLEPEE